MIPSKAKLNDSTIDGVRLDFMRAAVFPRFHRGAVLVAEQVQEPVHERRPPRLPDDLRAEDDVAERPRHPRRQLLPPVDREGEDVGRLVDPEVVALQRPHLVGPGEREPELAVLDALAREDAARQLDGGRLVDLGAAPVLDLDDDHARHFLRAVPVSSACCL